MQAFSSTDVAKRFGAIAQIVQREPVSVQSHGRPQLVMLSPQEYARLRQCVVVVCVEDVDGERLVTVAPTTHSATPAPHPPAQAGHACVDEAKWQHG